MDETTEDFSRLYDKFLIHCIGRRSLHLHYGVGYHSHVIPLLGSNWFTIDLERLETEANETAGYNLILPANYFDAVLCTGLEHIAVPELLLYDIRRGLKPSGHVWIEVSLNSPYRPIPTEYRRITPKGLRIMMRDFDEIFCAAYSPKGSPLRSMSSFYGLKRTDDPTGLSSWRSAGKD
ncbi:MAG: class I SAM-dependent methyltransferase [Chromatiales bacterium]|nr:class I SAM-dependent methyltransferase [Chromatiales bacterium]